MTRHDKIKFLREVESQAGLVPFSVDAYSDEDDVNTALMQCIYTIDILDSLKEKINEAIEVETEPEPNYSIVDATKR